MNTIIKFIGILLLSSVTVCAGAVDLIVTQVKESHLPYEFSPSNYENSSSNYDNSVSNYDNSSSNYENSPSNYLNSASNYDNGPAGSKRLLIKNGGTLKFVGYFVISANGVTNFFTPSGARVFFNPKKTSAVFSGSDGLFAGVIADIRGDMSLVLTEHGMRRFMLAQ
jgi:hypothetical protein